MYKLLQPLLFRLDAETAHDLTFALLRLLYMIPGFGLVVRALFAHRIPALPVELMGLRFANPIGLAAGLDKNARHVRMLADLGFGALELGTVTPNAQEGNPKRRLFRLVRQHALINRMGFNNVGIDAFLRNLRRAGKPCVVGVNIGKNGDTPLERAVDDYLQAFRAVYTHADYVTVNISSPNTPDLRTLQERDRLESLLRALKNEQLELAKTRRVYVPIALKIAPDLSDAQIDAIARLVLAHKFDAVIATNTTISRPALNDELLAKEDGGLSGGPLGPLSTAVIRQLYQTLQGKVPIIGVGGIETADDAWEKLVAGADALQLYTGLIYEGPRIVGRIVGGLTQRVKAAGCATLADAIARARHGVE